MAAPIASYLNIPLLVEDGGLRKALEVLGVKEVIEVGDVSDVEGKLKLRDKGAIITLATEILKDMGGVRYIALANPADSFPVEKDFVSEGSLSGTLDFTLRLSAMPVVEMPFLALGKKTLGIEVPDGINLIKVETTFDPDNAYFFHGDTIYYDPTGKVIGYQETGATGQMRTDFEFLTINRPGKYEVMLCGNWGSDVPVKLHYEIERLESPLYPQLSCASSLAPYLAAYHGGLVLADEKFAALYGSEEGSASPADFPSLSNERAEYVREAILDSINFLEEEGLLEGYMKSPHLAIVADPSMVPMYYASSMGLITENLPSSLQKLIEAVPLVGDFLESMMGLIPTDNFYAGVENWKTKLDLAVGRVMASDISDLSALIARSCFYYKYLDGFQPDVSLYTSRYEWKNSSLVLAGVDYPIFWFLPFLPNPAILMTTPTYLQMLDFFAQKNFNVYSAYGYADFPFATQATMKQAQDELKLFTSSNFLFIAAHGDYYRFIPAPWFRPLWYEDFSSAYASSLEMGPSVQFMVSCTAGRTDWVPLDYSLSMAMIGSGVNCYVATTRTGMVGLDLIGDDYWIEGGCEERLGQLFFKELTEENLTTGMAFMKAKNDVLNEQRGLDYLTCYGAPIEYAQVTLYGDPAFNPYEPCNEGASAL
jgi:hypothetical protein